MNNKSSLSGSTAATPAKERGKRAFQAGRFMEAIAHWREIAEPDESLKRALAEAHFRQADALHLAESSLPHLRNALEMMPNDPVYIYWYGVALHKNGRIREALTEYQRAEALPLAQAPGAAQRNPALSLWLAQHHTHASLAWPEPAATPGDPRHATPRMVYDAVARLARNTDDETKKALAQLSEMSPKPLARDVGAHRYAYMGVAHARRGHEALAIENWRLAARALPSHPLVQTNLAAGRLIQIHEALTHQDVTTALKLAAEADAANGTLTAALSGLYFDAALAAAQQSKWGEAAQQLKRVAQSLQEGKANERRPILHNLALLCEMAEDWSAAADTWREVLRMLPRGRRSNSTDGAANDARKWIRRRAIDCYKRADQLSEAIKVLRQSLKQTPEDVDTRLDLVRALYANEQESAAENEAQRLLEKDPNHLETLLQLGEMQLESGRFYASEKNLEHALSVAPNDRRTHTGLAKVLHQQAHHKERQGEYTQAIGLFERAIQHAPEDSGVMLCASRAYAHEEQKDKARELLNRLLTVGKNKPDTYYNIARFWADEQNSSEIDAVIAQAEVNGILNASLLGMIGMEILNIVYPEPPIDILNALFNKYGMSNSLRDSPLMRRPAEPTEPKLRDYAHGLLQRAMQHPSADPQTLQSAFIPLLSICPHEVLPYCQWMTERRPNDANSWVILGCAQALQKHFKEAETAFERARTLAKAAKESVVEEMAREFRRNLYDPEFPDMVRDLFASIGRGTSDVDLDDF